MTELDPVHLAVAEAARAKVMALIGTINVVPEAVVEPVSEIPVLDLRF